LVDLQFTILTGCTGKSCHETSALLDDTLDEALRAGLPHFKCFRQFYAAFGKAATFDSSRLHETITPTKAPQEPQACNMPTRFNSSKILGVDADPPSEHGSSDGMDPTDQWNAMHGIFIDSDDECTRRNTKQKRRKTTDASTPASSGGPSASRIARRHTEVCQGVVVQLCRCIL
jgi:hypothetical protein